MFGYTIMDNRQKQILREYFGFRNIRSVVREMGADSIDEAWEQLQETYMVLEPPRVRRRKLLRIKKKFKLATKEQRAKAKRKREQAQRNRAFEVIRRNFRNYVARRRARVQLQDTQIGVQTRTYQPQFAVPFTQDNLQRLTNLVMTNISRPAQNQHLVISFRFFVLYVDGTTMYQNRKVFDANYSLANRNEFIRRLYNNINEQLGLGFGNTKGYSAYVINIRITSTLNQQEGGCGGRNPQGKEVKLGGKTTYWKLFSPRGTESTNNCLFKCLEVDPTKTRKALSIPPKTKINIDQLPAICDYLDIGVNVYDAQKRILLNYPKPITKELVLIQNHYLLIKVKSKRCEDCGKVYENTHTCNNRRIQYYRGIVNNEKTVIPNTKIFKDEPILYDEQVIYYDFETFMENGSFVCYAVGYYDPIKQLPQHFYGKDCLRQFINFMITQKNKTFIAHNGARFDSYFVIREMLNQGIQPEDIIMNNGAIMTYNFGEGNKLLDSCCFISSTLAKAGKSFNIPEEYYKSEFNHNKIKSWEDTEKYRTELVKYLDLDIYCLKYVWEAFSDKIFDKFKVHTIDFITTSSMTYALWKTHNDKLIYLPTQEELAFIQRSTYGANVYPVKKHFKSKQYDDVEQGKIKYDELTDYLKIMDVVSLYPTSMLNKYPTGRAEWVKEYYTDKLGIYDISFTPPKDILFSQLPRKTEQGGIEHSLEQGRGVYNSVDIERAKDAGYVINKVHLGLVWNNAEKVFKDYIEDTFRLKCKAKEDDDPVMYAISKLLLNGLYGKTLQRPIFHKTEIINTHKDAISFINNHEIIENIEILSPEFVLYNGMLKPADKDDAITKPTQLGSFVLGYSRTIMYDIIKAIDPTLKTPCFYYTDTDCLHIHAKDIPKVEHILGDELGQMNSDLDNEGKIIEGIYLAPKQYSVCYYDNKEQLHGKYKCKGIDKKYLKPKMYHDALELKSTEVKMTDRFKKIHYKQNSNQQQYNKFSIHLEDIDRTFYKNEWLGREWLGNYSFPIGHNYPKKRLITSTGIPNDVAELIVKKIK